MFFDVKHEFDISLDALELAVLSPDLHERLRERLDRTVTLEQASHQLAAGTLSRTWAFRAEHLLPSKALRLLRLRPRDGWQFEERSTYRLGEHRSDWQVTFKLADWLDKRTVCGGTYHLYPLGRGRARRVVAGQARVSVPALGPMLEEFLVKQIRSLFDIEARTLREMVNLL